MLTIPANFLKSRPFVCPTTQVCVEQCPTATTHYKFGNYQQHRICTYDVDPKNTDNENLVSQGKCAPYVIASKSYFGRCIPIRLGTVTNTIIQVWSNLFLEHLSYILLSFNEFMYSRH